MENKEDEDMLEEQLEQLKKLVGGKHFRTSRGRQVRRPNRVRLDFQQERYVWLLWYPSISSRQT
jgi:hypothetical protein